MTEIEKMTAGIPYNSADSKIKELHMRGKRLMWEFNRLAPNDIVTQRDILCQMLGAFGKGARINQPLWIDCGSNIYLGQDSFINMNCTLLDANKIVVGNRTLLAPDVKIYTALHPKNGTERYTETGTLVTRLSLAMTVGLAAAALSCRALRLAIMSLSVQAALLRTTFPIIPSHTEFPAG